MKAIKSATKSKQIYYTDPLTGSRRWTRGTFRCWQQSNGEWHAIFDRAKSPLRVKEALIEPESRRALPPLPAQPYRLLVVDHQRKTFSTS